MQAFFFESPLLIGVWGAAVAGIAGYVWTQTGHKAAFYSGLGAILLTVILVLVNLQVETNRERIRSVVDSVATALDNNDHTKVFQFIHPNAAEGIARAKAELPRYTFEEARVTRIKSLEVNTQTTPPTAIAEFNVYCEIETQGQKFRVPRFVVVYFMLKDDRWLVHDYEHYEPTAGFRDTPLGR